MGSRVCDENKVPLVERFPLRWIGGRQVLYAVGFSDGRVKFGKCVAPRGRLRFLCRSDSQKPVWAHLFGTVKGTGQGKACAAEVAAWDEAAKRGAQRLGRSEYFVGLTKAQAIECGRVARFSA